MANKKAFDLPRSSTYTADPIKDLRIIGGLRLPKEEQGDLDTALDKANSLHDERLDMPLDDTFVAGIAFYGVKVPIIISKIDDIPTVVDGRERVRAARRINRERAKRGEPLISINCTIQRSTDEVSLISTMVATNEQRIADEFPVKLEKVKRMIDRGMSPEAIALAFNVKLPTVQGWLAFDEHATAATKQAMKDGRLGATAAATLARIHDPAEQAEALAKLLSTPDRTVRRATRVANSDSAMLVGKRNKKAFLAAVQEADHKNASKETLAFWAGVEEMLKAELGLADVDKRLTDLAKKLDKP